MEQPISRDWSPDMEEAAKKLGMSFPELRALIKPLFFVLYDNKRTSITITRHDDTKAMITVR